MTFYAWRPLNQSDNTSNYYVQKFKALKLNRSGGFAKPHKICMLYAVMDLIQEGEISWNVIYYTDELKRRYKWHFNRLRIQDSQPNPCYPFYYLKSSGFWRLESREGKQGDLEKLNTPTELKIVKLVEYATLDSELFILLKNPSKALVLRMALASQLDSKEEAFEHWALSIGKSEKTVKNYIGALKNSISNWFEDAGVTHDTNILNVSDFFEMERIVNQSNKVQEFVEHNRRGNGMYRAALNLYRGYLNEITQATVNQEITDISSDPKLEETQKEILIQARRGQGRFRTNLIEHWNQRCSVTGYNRLPLLVASHIKPWHLSSNQERLDPYNGLLLVANLDKAFDLNYISFRSNGRILISEALGNFQKLGIDSDMLVKLEPERKRPTAPPVV